MHSSSVDLVALIRAVFISLGCGLIMMALSFIITKTSQNKEKWKRVIIFGILGVMIIIGVFVYSLWPSLISTPNLADLSQAEATQLLLSNKLIPDPKPQYSVNTEEGRVIPNSQSPIPGLKVDINTTVSYNVSISRKSGVIIPDSISKEQINFSVFGPLENEYALCRCSSEGICTISVTGTSSNLNKSNLGLLLWVKPINPSSEVNGWYLQRPPNSGINNIEQDGSWIGSAQVGSPQYPPHEGDIIYLALTCTDINTIYNLMAESGVVRKEIPLGIKTIYQKNVRISLKKN